MKRVSLALLAVAGLTSLTLAAKAADRPPELTPIPTFKTTIPTVSTATDGLPAAVTPKSPLRVWVDQIGYRATGRKLLIVAASQAVPEKPNLELVDYKSGQTVWKLADHADAYKIFKDNKKDGESGDFVAQLDLTAFQTPGRYYVKITTGGAGETVERSYLFNIADNVFLDVGRASWKSFYFQRATGEKPEKFAGPWNDGPQYMGKDQSPEAHEYIWTGGAWFTTVGTVIADPAPRDVTGGWWDAGNFDLYMGNTTNCHIRMLLGIQLTGKTPDGDLNIPESGNGIPDILDETRVGTTFFLHMADETGAAYGREYQSPECPPSKSTKPVMLTSRSSGATMNRAANLAYAAVVWTEMGYDKPFAKQCLDESMKSWQLLEARPHPWPNAITYKIDDKTVVNVDDKVAALADLKPEMEVIATAAKGKTKEIRAFTPKPGAPTPKLTGVITSIDAEASKVVVKTNKMQYTGEWFCADYAKTKALAAACYFRATGDKKYADLVKAEFIKVDPKTNEPAFKLDGNGFEHQATAWVYAHTPGADPELVKKMKDAIFNAAEGFAKSSGSNRAYGAGLGGYGWGSNQAIGSNGQTCLVAAEFSDDPAAKQKYLDTAEEFVHYLHGRNPLGWCYVTNMRPFGAEHATCVMFHSWFGNPGHQDKTKFGYKYIGEGEGKLGPPPGYIVGGANGGMRTYYNGLGGEPWVYNENCLGYQGQCTALIGYFGYKVK